VDARLGRKERGETLPDQPVLLVEAIEERPPLTFNIHNSPTAYGLQGTVNHVVRHADSPTDRPTCMGSASPPQVSEDGHMRTGCEHKVKGLGWNSADALGIHSPIWYKRSPCPYK
jgi:hypothetical protein